LRNSAAGSANPCGRARKWTIWNVFCAAIDGCLEHVPKKLLDFSD
jgi:hypothetical protein